MGLAHRRVTQQCREFQGHGKHGKHGKHRTPPNPCNVFPPLPNLRSLPYPRCAIDCGGVMGKPREEGSAGVRGFGGFRS